MLLKVLSELVIIFLSALSSTDPKFPSSEWNRLTPQAVITLNILRNERVSPKLSAHAYLHGNFDFTDTKFASPRTRVLIN